MAAKMTTRPEPLVGGGQHILLEDMALAGSLEEKEVINKATAAHSGKCQRMAPNNCNDMNTEKRSRYGWMIKTPKRYKC